MECQISAQFRAVRVILHLGVVLAAVWLAACADIDGLHTSAYITGAGQIHASDSLKGVPLSAAAWPNRKWWKRFGDDQLDRLVDHALRGQPRLRVAEARVRAAKALAVMAGASLYPGLNASATSERERFSEHGTVPPPIAGTWQTINAVSLGLGYELDFWGKNRAALSAALGIGSTPSRSICRRRD